MFDAMRRNMKSIMWFTAGSFVLLIFLAWGAEYNLGSGKTQQSGVLGTVNGQPIQARAYSNRVLQAREGYRQQGQNLDEATEAQLRIQAWDALVQEMLVKQEISRLGIEVSDQEIIQAIRNQPLPFVTQTPEFQTDGRFDYTKYLNALRDPNRNWLPLEQIYREEIPKQKLQQLVASSVKVGEADVRRQFEAENIKASVAYASVQVSAFPVDSESADESAVRAHYDANKDDYLAEEMARVRFVRFEKKATAADTSNALELVRLAAQESREGEQFDILVSAYSEAPQELLGGPDGAYMTREQFTAPAVREAAFSLAVGEISEILTEDDGFHLIRVEDRRTTEDGAEQVKIADIFLPVILSPETIIELRDRSTNLANRAVEFGGDLGAAVAEPEFEGMEVIEPEAFGRQGFSRGLGRLGQFSSFRDWAFNSSIGAIRTLDGPEALYVIQLTEQRDPGPSPFEEVSDRVKSDYINSRQSAKAAERLQGVLAKARGGMPLADAAGTDTLATFDTTDEFARRGFARGLGNDPKLMARIFSNPIGLVPEVLETNRGAYLIEILSRTDPPDSLYTERRDAIRAQIDQRRRSEVVNRWMQELRTRAEIEDYRGDFEI